MPKVNPYYIPKENQIKTEEVRYLNTEIPSYEEFMKTYDYDEALMASYEVEINAQERGYGPCYYCPYEVESWRPGGKHINRCGSLNCSYYRRIVDNKVFRGVGHGISTGAAIGFWAALAATPFTGGASLAMAAGLSTAASASMVGGNALTAVGGIENLNGIENELRLKWETEQTKEKISNLQSELNKVKSELREVIEKRDQYRQRWGSSNSDYLREKERAESLENQVKNLKRDLCRERGCGCGGYCV